jgi:diguanylate cyclase (GGDEF)-like protein/PAS domain S-box-containing protein
VHSPDLPRRPLRQRLQQIVLVCILVSLLVTAGLSQLSQQYFSRQGLLDELRTIGNLLGNRSIAAMIFEDPEAASGNLASARHIPSILRLCLYDQQQNLFSSYHADTATAGTCSPVLIRPDTLTDYVFKPRAVQLLLPIHEQSDVFGYLLIDGSLQGINTKMQQSLAILLAAFFLSTITALLLSRRLLKQALRPLTRLHEHTRLLSENPFNTPAMPAQIREHNDEITDLMRAYRQMLSTIQLEHAHLQKSEARFRGLAENSPVGIYQQSGPGNYSYVNNRWAQITGCVEQSDQDAYSHFIHPADRNTYEQTLARVFNTGTASSLEYRFFSPLTGQKRVLMEYLSAVTDHLQPHNVVGVIGSVLDISDLKQAQSELEHLAFYDALTNLPNRRFFRDHLDTRIASALKDGSQLSVLMLDLDNFKAINDSMGHDAGDNLLKEVGFRLRSQIFTEDVVARLGGDEFIILLEHTHTGVDINLIVDRLLGAVVEPLLINQQTVDVSCSIGVARFPQDAGNSQDLIHHADMAMYQAKAKGKNCADYYSVRLNEAIQERIRLSRKLRTALHEDLLEIYIQPQFDLRRGTFFWGEVLLRWHDRDEGMIGPDRFIPLAEESGLIVELGQWVTREACRVLATHRSHLARAGITGLAINLSAQEFYHKGLLPYLQEQLHTFRLPATCLEFELTESMVMEDIERAIATMKELQQLGFKLSLDDFGTGYSSLAYLKKLNINQLKIDKSFVDGLPHDKNDEAITGAILAMASKLGLEVIAEGIETAEQSEFLMARGCTLMQGYLYARPMPVGQLLDFCDQQIQLQATTGV